MVRRLVLTTAVLIAAPGSAHAGRTFFGWLYGSEVMPERGVELQSWLTEENFKNDVSSDSWLLSAQVGVTDQLELGFPVDVVWERIPGAMPGDPPRNFTRFDRFGIEARYRFVSQDAVEAPAIAPLLRVGVDRMIGERDGIRPSADFVISWETGIVQVLANVGFVGELNIPGDDHYELHQGAGVSVLAVDDLRFGAETYSEVHLDNRDANWIIAGPNLSWTHGRFWISGAFGIGLIQDRIKTAPRVQWGIAF